MEASPGLYTTVKSAENCSSKALEASFFSLLEILEVSVSGFRSSYISILKALAGFYEENKKPRLKRRSNKKAGPLIGGGLTLFLLFYQVAVVVDFETPKGC
jgi:hypothetical protein